MKKSEFLDRLSKELTRKNIPDIADILGEYEQHFAFKLADGFSEEEIAAKLGDPAQIAAQFGLEEPGKDHTGRKATAVIRICCTDLFVGIFFILLVAWGIVLAAFSLCSGAVAVCLLVGLQPEALIPPMPYGSAVLFGIAMAAMAVFSGVGCIYFSALTRQLGRAYGRFHHNVLAAASGGPVLPAITVYPSFLPKAKRRLRRIVLISLLGFAVFSILGIFVSMACSGSLGFWHAWGWFGYTN